MNARGAATGERLRVETRSLAGRCWLTLVVAIAVIALDHGLKLGAAAVEPADYTHNPTPVDDAWLLLLPSFVLLYPSRLVAIVFALWVGGSASNLIDTYVWPGGVPDFIPVGDWIMNPADFFIYGAGVALLILAVGWPIAKLFVLARRRYPEPARAEAPREPEAVECAAAPNLAETATRSRG